MVHWQVIFANRRTCYGLSGVRSARQKIWRLPTLAQAIQALPSATLRLTAEFGMGSGRTTALLATKKHSGQLSVVSGYHGHRLQLIVKEQLVKIRGSRNSRPRTTNKW